EDRDRGGRDCRERAPPHRKTGTPRDHSECPDPDRREDGEANDFEGGLADREWAPGCGGGGDPHSISGEQGDRGRMEEPDDERRRGQSDRLGASAWTVHGCETRRDEECNRV